MASPGKLIAAAALALAVACANPSGPARSLREVAANPDYVEIRNGAGVRVALRYATTDNFTHANLYGGFRHAFLHREAARKLDAAIAILEREHPGWRLVIWDALRPRSVQRLFWDRVKGTPKQKYVADPGPGSIHNFGFAVDLTLADASRRPLDMGTDFDDFSPAAEPQLESGLLAQGRLTRSQVANRLILRDIMTRAGFVQLPEEWWHYDALPGGEVRARYRIVE
jgi:D-alanyl-D-alanine dipeptidase